jgi:hypothetical protein
MQENARRQNSEILWSVNCQFEQFYKTTERQTAESER